MGSETFVKCYRRMLDWEWYSDSVTKDVFLHILLTANWKKGRYKGVDLEPGDAVVGRKKLASDLGFTEQQVRTALKKLESTGEITKKSTNRFSVITVVNWRQYQGTGDESNQQTTNNQPTNNQQITNNQPHLKKEKKEKKEKNIYNAHACARETDLSEFSPKLQEAIRDWLTYKDERKEGYRPKGLQAWLGQVRNHRKIYDDKHIIAVIEKTMSCQYKGVVWDWLNDKPRKPRQVEPEPEKKNRVSPEEHEENIRLLREKMKGAFS